MADNSVNPVSPLTIIIPVLNDLNSLQVLLPAIQPWRAQGHEILIVDGGSVDGSMTYARSLADRVLMTGTGRGRQMNLGAENAKHDYLLFLHADTRPPVEAASLVQKALANENKYWGRFDVSLDAPGVMYTVIAFMMNLRSRLSGVATGDQGIFVRSSAFHAIGGYASIPLMEDVALSKSLRRRSWPVCLSARLVTSARRWQDQGVLRTILLMWKLRLAYFLGANPETLVKAYYPPKSPQSKQDHV